MKKIFTWSSLEDNFKGNVKKCKKPLIRKKKQNIKK